MICMTDFLQPDGFFVTILSVCGVYGDKLPILLQLLLDIQFGHLAGIFLNELKAQFGFFAHQLVNAFGGLQTGAFGDYDAQQGSFVTFHGGFLQLGGGHLAEALKSADFNFAPSGEV